jgi:hypothetical protein
MWQAREWRVGASGLHAAVVAPAPLETEWAARKSLGKLLRAASGVQARETCQVQDFRINYGQIAEP